MTGAIFSIKQSTELSRAMDSLEARMMRFKRSVVGWRSAEDFAKALDYLNEELQPAFDEVRIKLEETQK